MKKALNKNLHAATNSKKDEFYTQLSDIEKELKHYKDHFKGKVVLCNRDDPRVSNFFHYFSNNFETLGLKKLITTRYKHQNRDLFSESGRRNEDRIRECFSVDVRSTSNNFSYTCSEAECVDRSDGRNKRVKHAA